MSLYLKGPPYGDFCVHVVYVVLCEISILDCVPF